MRSHARCLNVMRACDLSSRAFVQSPHPRVCPEMLFRVACCQGHALKWAEAAAVHRPLRIHVLFQQAVAQRKVDLDIATIMFHVSNTTQQTRKLKKIATLSCLINPTKWIAVEILQPCQVEAKSGCHQPGLVPAPECTAAPPDPLACAAARCIQDST
jgi:hypothetical protein